MRVWMSSDGRPACTVGSTDGSTDVSNMCKVNTDLKAGASVLILPGLGSAGTDLTLTCEGQYGFAPQALSVLRLATGKPSANWSDFTCADMTKNMTAHFDSTYAHNKYLKGTMKDTLKAYGVACCGSLGKTRDPCEVRLSTPARAKFNGGYVLAGQRASSGCSSNDCALEHRHQVAATGTPATSTPSPTAQAPTDTKHFVVMTVTMPYRSVQMPDAGEVIPVISSDWI